MQVGITAARLGSEATQQSRGFQDASERTRLDAAVRIVSNVIRKYAAAMGRPSGKDCYQHAVIGRALLQDLGFDTRLVIGHAAWRVGPGDGDVLVYVPCLRKDWQIQGDGLIYHAWLEICGLVVDFTSYQLRQAAQDLDRLDGRHTTVSWCPDYLVLPLEDTRSFYALRQGSGVGLTHYEERPELADIVEGSFVLDRETRWKLRVILLNPMCEVRAV